MQNERIWRVSCFVSLLERFILIGPYRKTGSPFAYFQHSHSDIFFSFLGVGFIFVIVLYLSVSQMISILNDSIS